MPFFLRSLAARLASIVRYPAGLVLAASLLGTPAQAQDSTLARLVRRYSFPLTQNGVQLAGPGWDKLQQDVRQSQLVLLGEDHGLAQIPVLATALARELKPELYVAEIDRYQAEALTRLAAQPGLPTAYHRQHPMGLSFYSWAEEFELARYLRSQRVPLVGIEQVSIMAPGSFFTLLAGQVQHAAARSYLLGRAAAYQAQDRAVMRTGQGRFSIVQQRPAALDSLRQLAQQESPQVQQMVADFVASSQIYTLNATEGLKSHQLRVNLMKRNLLTALQPYQQPGQPLPRMLFKFGAMHTGRGASFLGGVYDVGNLALNLADAHDQKSLHLFVMGLGGTKNNGLNPDDFSQNVKPYTSADEPMIKPFVAAQPNGAWQVLDLRALRRALLREQLLVTALETRTMIMNYDYLVLIPQTTASHNY